MATDLYFYSTPKGARLTLTLDAGGDTLLGVPCTAHGRDDAQRITLPTGTGTQGSLLEVSCDGYTPFAGRGIVDVEAADPYEDAEAAFLFDDIRLQELVVTPTPEPPDPPTPPSEDHPEGIIAAVYDETDADLSTHDGCGQFTEDCCTALHEQDDPLWGHIRKDPGQNQYNGHAVDALYLLAGEGAGVYDIIHDSVSPTASPQYIWKDAGDPNLWYYPTADDAIVLTAMTEQESDTYREQLRKHIAAIDGRRPQDGHSERGFSTCPHPDCVAVHPVPPSMADAAEMLWVVLANVSGGDWTKQSDEWQEAAARWRDYYFKALKQLTSREDR